MMNGNYKFIDSSESSNYSKFTFYGSYGSSGLVTALRAVKRGTNVVHSIGLQRDYETSDIKIIRDDDYVINLSQLNRMFWSFSATATKRTITVVERAAYNTDLFVDAHGSLYFVHVIPGTTSTTCNVYNLNDYNGTTLTVTGSVTNDVLTFKLTVNKSITVSMLFIRPINIESCTLGTS